jgi:hypothetical protein
LTATATRRVVGDIIRQLGMKKPDGFKGSFFRSNLTLLAHKKGDGRGSRKDLLAYVRRRAAAGENGIIYTLSRKNVESLADFLRSAGVRALPYHAGLDDAVRTRHQDAFARDEADVVVATIAFGMGIDKSNVRYVIHRELPRSIEGYYQEIGRAGRDGLPSDCILLYSWADVVSHQRFQESIDDAQVRAQARAKSVAAFELADAPGCRWQRLVAYFDETARAVRRVCDACRGTTFVDLVAPVKGVKSLPLAPSSSPTLAADVDDDLFQRLRALRRALADGEGVPAYIVFSDAVLARMAALRPKTKPASSPSPASVPRSSRDTAPPSCACCASHRDARSDRGGRTSPYAARSSARSSSRPTTSSSSPSTVPKTSGSASRSTATPRRSASSLTGSCGRRSRTASGACAHGSRASRGLLPPGRARPPRVERRQPERPRASAIGAIQASGLQPIAAGVAAPRPPRTFATSRSTMRPAARRHDGEAPQGPRRTSMRAASGAALCGWVSARRAPSERPPREERSESSRRAP